MNLGTTGSIVAILAGCAVVIGLLVDLRGKAKARAEKDEQNRQSLRDKAYAAGVESQAWMITQLQNQVTQMTAERDEERADNRELARQISSLEAELRRRAR